MMAPPVVVLRSEPEEMAEMAKFVEVALVVVARVNTPVDAVEAPIAVLLIVPPEMVRSSATSLSAQSNERVPVFWSAPLSTLPDEGMVRASEVYASEGVEDAETRPPTAWSGPVREPMYSEVVVALVERRCGKVLVEVVVAVK